MNKETKVRTALRAVVSIYTGLCVWQVAINELGDMLGTKWIAIICAILIVLFGLAVDVLTTYYNNDYTPEACEGTGLTRLLKRQKNQENYSGERFEGEDLEVSDESRNLPSVR